MEAAALSAGVSRVYIHRWKRLQVAREVGRLNVNRMVMPVPEDAGRRWVQQGRSGVSGTRVQPSLDRRAWDLHAMRAVAPASHARRCRTSTPPRIYLPGSASGNVAALRANSVCARGVDGGRGRDSSGSSSLCPAQSPDLARSDVQPRSHTCARWRLPVLPFPGHTSHRVDRNHSMNSFRASSGGGSAAVGPISSTYSAASRSAASHSAIVAHARTGWIGFWSARA